VLARDAYRLNVVKGGWGPAFLSAPDRVDHVEIVAVQDGETIFYWDLDPGRARRLARALREDLGTLSPDEFHAAWEQAAREGA
jgi:hypothetical protein